ncbi:MAG: ABC transporter permease subunit [Anaerolineales bacterium]|nr:ABC transporter permease subunit [Anaerolineales bacterium]
MRNIWTIARREYDQYFISPIAYVVAVALLFILGGYFAFLLVYANQNFGFVPDVNVINDLFAFLLLLSIPALTMRVLADETRTGTIELLLTAPVRDFELVAGKWLGSFLFVLTLILVTAIYPLILRSQVTPGLDWKLMLSSYLGLILLSAAFVAIGVGLSAVFSNQVTAFITTIAVLITLWWLIGIPANVLPTGGEFFRYMQLNTHFANALNAGSLELSNLVYFFSLIAIGLFTGTVAIEVRRWK